jgi:zinc transport system permease protein
MAVGVLFVFITPGYVPELNAFLFGNLLTITHTDLLAFAIYTVVLIIFFCSTYHYVVACAFDRDFAQVRGLPVRIINYAMTALVAICIVLTIRLVGIMLLMSMLTLPQMIAEIFVRRFGKMAITSTAISVATGVGGLALATIIDVPCAAIIVLLQISTYAIAAVVTAFIRK